MSEVESAGSAAANTEPQPPQFRLPTFAAPQRYRINLTVTPDKDTFTGTVEIDLTFKESSPVLWLNAQDIAVKDAELTVAGETLSAKVLPQPKDLVGFSFEHSVSPGRAMLRVAYEGKVSRKDTQGIFQVKDGDRWYVYSQFEDIYARRAFPCFDEPSYKVPWQVTLNVPKDDRAFSNTPMLSEAEGPEGTKTVKFMETRPLPSYLVAIAVGPMEIIEADHAGAKNTAIRIIVPQGRGAEAQFVAATTPDVVNLLEKYFGIPYPYEKLDEVAVPLYGGAMENAGLVTYGAGFFLWKPEETTLQRQREATDVMAHELAHQWFGDLVTTAWWDDIWLNEGFASWMADKIVDEYKPEWKTNIGAVNAHQGAMGADELVSARKVRQPILSNHDIANAFDDITYGKGSALLAMFESYMSPEKFREGIRRYLEKYAWGNATSAEFLEALGGGDRTIAQAFSTFLDQPGVPLVTARLNCADSRPRLQLSQQRFLPRGSQGSSEQTWDIPFCIRYPAGSNEARECMLMTKMEAVMPLTKAEGCPAWVYPNAGEVGYYRVRYEGGILAALLKDEQMLALPERVGLIGNIAALTAAYLPLGEALALVPKFAHDPNREVVAKTLWIVGNLHTDGLVPADLKPKSHRFISDLYKERAEQLGWKAKPGEDDDSRLLRPTLLEVVANDAEDAGLIEQARKLALAWLDDHKAVEPDMVSVVLNTAARHGDRALFDRFRAQAKKETDEDLQSTLIYNLGSFRDPAIVKTALPIILTDEFDIRQSLGILFGATLPETRDLAYDFVKQNWDALVAKLPTDAGAFLPSVAGGYCDDEHRADAEVFFKDRSTKYTGGPRNLAQVLEGMSLCVANKRANQASVVEFLKNY
jgi:alanyl aminopeptidase